ncbi:MAG: acetyltransferase [Oligoflexia bacterium]|nr:acetyltransferase [Oligoflexia bacterium]
MNGKTIYIIGDGGHAKVLKDCCELYKVEAKFISLKESSNPNINESDFLKLADENEVNVILGIGSTNLNSNRDKIIEKYSNHKNIRFTTLVHPTAIISRDVVIGNGSYIGAGAILCPNSKVGNHCIINTGAIIEHDSIIKNYTHVACGSVCLGASTVGENSLIGANATILQACSFPGQSVLGAGSVLTKTQTEEGLYVGSPAKKKF